MEEDIFEEQKKPTLKELIFDYKDKKTRPIKRFFNTTYVVTTLLAYFYYVFYVTRYLVKNGVDTPISIMLLIAVSIYTLILVVCAVMSSSIKTAKKRIKRSMRVFKYFKRSITIISSVVAVMALISTLQAEQTSGWAVFVSIVSLILNFLKIMFSLMFMGLSAGTSALKFGAKQTIKHVKKEIGLNKKSAPTKKVSADDDNLKID